MHLQHSFSSSPTCDCGVAEDTLHYINMECNLGGYMGARNDLPEAAIISTGIIYVNVIVRTCYVYPKMRKQMKNKKK